VRPRFPILLFGGGAGGGTADGGVGGGAGGGTGGSGTSGAPAPAAGAPAPGGTVSDWRAGLTGEFEPLRTEKSLEVFKGKDWNEVGPVLAKTVASQSKLVGSSVRIPGADAKPEEVAAFREKIGVPKDISGYKDVKLPDVPGKTWDVARIDGMAKPAFHKMGLTPQQAQEALGLFADYIQQSEKATLDSFMEGQDSLMDKWGLAFDSNTNLAYRTLEKFFPQPFIKLIQAAGLDAHPDFLQGFHAIGKNFAEDGIIDGSGIGAPTMEDLDKQISETRGKIAAAPQGSAARDVLEKQLQDLYKARHPEPVVGRRS